MKDKRRNHSAQFKAKVALAAAKGDKTTAVAGDSLRRTASEFGVHPNQIAQWKKQLLQSLPELFSRFLGRGSITLNGPLCGQPNFSNLPNSFSELSFVFSLRAERTSST